MRFTKEELEFLSDQLLARMAELNRITFSSRELLQAIKNDIERLRAINSVVCSEITHISS